MRILFCGDVVGRAGREAVTRLLPTLRAELQLNAVIVNVDNAAGGFGITREVCRLLIDAGATVLTGGDHVFDQKDVASLLESEPRLLRPHNFPPGTPGSGCRSFTLKDGRKLLVLHLLGQVFHKEYLDSPFACAAEALSGQLLGQQAQAIIVDMHAEATSEKQAMGIFLDGKVSAVVGSHTHVPTDDVRILHGGTAFQTDAGMCGDYAQTIIGFDPAAPLEQFLQKKRKIRMEPGRGAGTLRGLYVETDDKTGRTIEARSIARNL